MQAESTPAPPDDFGDPRAEYRAAREAAALFDLPARTHIELTGRDRAKFLHNFCTNDIRGMTPRRACEAFITSVQGKILAFVSVYVTPDALWLTSVPGCAEKIIGHLSRYQISEDVTFTDRSSEFETILVAGPQAQEVVERVLPTAEMPGIPGVVVVEFDKGTIQLRRHDFLRLPGWIFVAAPAAIDTLRERLTTAGVRAAGRNALEAIRIEAGFPLYGVDITDANLAQEASRTAEAISFSKGCYLGQEPIARIDALGHVNQQLRGLRLRTGRAPAAGSGVFTPDATPRPVGHVTSAAFSYADDRPVALAYVRRGSEMPDTNLDVDVNGRSVPAVVFWPSD